MLFLTKKLSTTQYWTKRDEGRGFDETMLIVIVCSSLVIMVVIIFVSFTVTCGKRQRRAFKGTTRVTASGRVVETPMSATSRLENPVRWYEQQFAATGKKMSSSGNPEIE